MSERVEKLRTLDGYDRDLRFLRGKIERLPQELAQAESDVAAAKEHLERTKKNQKTMQTRLMDGNVDLQSFEDKLNKLKMQLNVAKSNAEYKATQDEISKLEAKQSEVETTVLELMDQVDESKQTVKDKEAEVKASEQELARQREQVEREVAELKQQEQQIAEERKKFAETVDAEDLALYERTLQTRKDTALAPAKDMICTACHVRLTPQQYATAAMGEDLIRCQSCGRILIPSDN
jgi:hypothetical protein